jgi:hypothetical protein
MLHPRVLVSFLAFRSTHASSPTTNARSRAGLEREAKGNIVGGDKANLMGRWVGSIIGSGEIYN